MADPVPTWVDNTTPDINASNLNQGSVAIRNLQNAVVVINAAGNSGTALTINYTNGTVQTVTMTGNCTFALTGATSGIACSLELVLTQDGTGSRTATWPAAVKWSGGAPVLSTTAAAVDRILLTTYNGGTTWYGDLIGTGYA